MLAEVSRRIKLLRIVLCSSMATSKRKKQRKADKKARRELKRLTQEQAAQPLHQREDRNVLVAMTLASLVAGLLAIVNLDRATHASSLSKEQRLASTSLHGWPLVYLERDVAEKPTFYFSKRLYSWPIPAVDGEQRRWKVGNLIGDIGLALSITVAAYALISFVVKRYDRWKSSLPKTNRNVR